MTTTTPIYLAPLDREFIPHKYIMFVHSQHCDACGSLHKWSEVYGETRIRATMGHGYITNQRPALSMTQIQYNLPIEIIPRNSNIPFCHECLRPGMLAHKPNAPQPAPDARSTLVAMPIVQKAPTRTRWQRQTWQLARRGSRSRRSSQAQSRAAKGRFQEVHRRRSLDR